jgi:hypothetical protein
MHLTLSRNELLIFTDFSATCDLHAAKLDNCSQDAHAVLAIFVVCHSPRFVTVKQEEEDVRHRLNDCDVWYFFGDTISKGKKNDHIFHNACLKDIIQTYKRQFQHDGARILNQAKVWTDNCAGQYKCNQNFVKIATFPENVSGVLILHRFAQKYNFKGVWDAAGKVVKNYMRNSELTEGRDNRFATALDCSLKLRRRLRLKTPPWRELERNLDVRILQKTFFTVTGRKFGYATEDIVEWMLVSREHLHTVFTDRTNVPRMDPIDGTLKLHMVSGTWERGQQQVMVLESDELRTNKTVKTFKLKIASMPCVCTACRGDTGHACIFKVVRNEREEWIHELLANEQKPATSAEERERYKLVFLACRDRIRRALVAASMLGADGSENITVKTMKDFLRLRSQPTTGKKHELAKRIFDLPELEEVPVEGPLAAAYNIEGDDDLDAGGDDESVE